MRDRCINLVDAAIRFAISKQEVSTALVGRVYNRFGVLASQNKLVVNYTTDGVNFPYPKDLINPIKLNMWYRLTLRVDDLNGFRVEVRERDPSTGSRQARVATGNATGLYCILSLPKDSCTATAS